MLAGLASPLLVAALLASSPAAPTPSPAPTGPTLAELDEKRFEVHLLPRFGVRTLDGTSAGGSIQVGVGIRAWRGLYVDIEVGEGLYAPPLELSGQILAGLRYELRRSTKVRPNFFVGLTHLHQSHAEHFVHDPGHTIVGTAATIHHRSGAQAGLGLRFPFPAHWGRQAQRFSGLLRSDVAYYFDAAPARLQAGVSAGFAVVF